MTILEKISDNVVNSLEAVISGRLGRASRVTSTDSIVTAAESPDNRKEIHMLPIEIAGEVNDTLDSNPE